MAYLQNRINNFRLVSLSKL